jgi:CHAD domain-containing protein
MQTNGQPNGSSGLKIRRYAALQAGLRLDRVAFEVNRARRNADPETVHDLRVSIRRFVSCLKEFGRVFPGKDAKKVRKSLEAIMSLAGSIRDRDIAIKLGEAAELRPESPFLAALSQQRREQMDQLALALKPWAKQNRTVKWRQQLRLK